MAPHILPRGENPEMNTLEGGLLAGFICFVVLLLLLLLRCHRSRTNKKQTAEQSVEPFRVQGAVRPMMAESNPSLTSVPPPFSRQGLTASIVMPEKTIAHKSSSSDKAVVASKPEPPSASSTQSSYPPLVDTPSDPTPPYVVSVPDPTYRHHNRASSGFSIYAQYPFSPALNLRPSSTLSTSPTQMKPVRQLFEPSLPDELALVRYGECLTVLRSFDDGWCLVGRDTLRSRSSRTSNLYSRMASDTDNAEIGLVPAWVFIKALKGITVTRPFRNASINALQSGQNSPPSWSRNAVVSWSNFL